jgi:glutaredoxin-related protein/RNase P/RNase MRP subunit p29
MTKKVTSLFSEDRPIIFMEDFIDFLVLGFSDNRLEIYNPQFFNREYLGFFDSRSFCGIRKEKQKLVLIFKHYTINVLYENNCLKIEQKTERTYIPQKEILKNEEANSGTKVRKQIYISENTYMRVYYGNAFDIYVKKEGGEEKAFTRNHTNWVTDACIVGDSLFTSGYDGYIRKWNLKTGIYAGAYPVKKGWILSIAFIKDNFYIGTEYGELYSIPYNDIENIRINGGAIWNLYVHQDMLYSVSENGEIVGYNMFDNVSNYLKCSVGWLNAIAAVSQDNLIAVTSRGEIIKVDNNLLNMELLDRVNLWLNNLCIINGTVYAVAAEGIFLLYDLNTRKIETFKISCNQLIDICSLESQQKIAILSVQGELIIWDRQQNLIEKIIKCNGYHFTSMAYNCSKGYIYISTFEGTVLIVNIKKDYEICYRKVTEGRIWKVSYCPDNSRLAYISTSMKIGICDELIQNSVSSISVNDLVTTCLLTNDLLFTGNEKGEMKRYPVVIEERNMLSLISEPESIMENKFFEKNVILFIDDSKECTQYYIERDSMLLERYNLPYIKIDLSNNDGMRKDVVKRTGWNRFPQILFWGDFIASGSVLPEMLDSGTLDNMIEEKLQVKGGKMR